jgi:hypothetical protein
MSKDSNSNKRTPARGSRKVKRVKKELCAASEAIVAIKKLEDDKFELTMADGWKDVLPKKGEDDPGLLIMWDDDNIAATVTNFNGAGGNAPPFLGAPPFTIPGLKTALLTKMQVDGGGGGVVGNSLIAPNSVKQYCNVRIVAERICSYPFFVAHAVTPIGRFYILEDRKVPATATRHDNIPPPPGAGAAPRVSVFE